jgi:PIN domain nuclease of toxin-antitoxin system
VSRLLIDTDALLWWLTDDARLSPAAREAIAEPTNETLASAASAWEIAIKRSLGKLNAPDDLLTQVVTQGFEWLAISAEHAWEVSSLPLHHRDPFDRLLVAQSLVERAPIVTADERFAPYGVAVRW